MAEFAYKELGYRKVALFGIDTAGTLGMTDSFRDKFTALGGEILIYEKGPQAGTDFRTQISKIKATQPEAVYISGFQFEVGTFIKQAPQKLTDMMLQS
jgi:branched-chain amino acid transport system substrate-binding protein